MGEGLTTKNTSVLLLETEREKNNSKIEMHGWNKNRGLSYCTYIESEWIFFQSERWSANLANK